MGNCSSIGGVRELVPKQNTIPSISNKFLECGVIGEGISGDIKRVRMRGNTRDVYYALKSLDKNFTDKKAFFLQEVSILRKLRHDNIIRLVDVYEDKKAFHIVTDLCEGGDLAARICRLSQFSEKVAAKMIKKMLNIVDYVHSKNIVHRDLKPANFVFATKANGMDMIEDIKLIDFGGALMVNDDKVYNTMVGTAHYAAPELRNKKIKKTGAILKKSDVWSIGVITHVIVTGKPPFAGSNRQIYIAARNGEPDFTDTDLSEEAREFIEFVLEPDPLARPSIEDVLKHPWLSDKIFEHPIDPKALEMLRQFAVECIELREQRKSEHLLRHYSSSSLLVTGHSSSNLRLRSHSGGSDIMARMNSSGSFIGSQDNSSNVPNSAGSQFLTPSFTPAYDQTFSSTGSDHRHNSSFVVSDAFNCGDISEEEGYNSTDPSTPDSLSWTPPPIPHEISLYLSSTDISKVVSRLDDEQRAEVTTLVSHIQGNKKLTDADLTEVLGQFAERKSSYTTPKSDESELSAHARPTDLSLEERKTEYQSDLTDDNVKHKSSPDNDLESKSSHASFIVDEPQ